MKPMYWVLGGLGIAGLLSLLRDNRYTGGTVPHKMEEWLPLIQASTKGSKVKASVMAAIIENESAGNPNATRFECFDRSRPEGKRNFGGPEACPVGTQRMDVSRMDGKVPMMSTGLNQFLISSGESHGLRCTVEPSTDERRDPTKSIPAGVRFLSDLLRKVGSEDGMIVAYNKGAGGAQKYLKANGSFAGVDYLTHIRAKQQKYLHLDA